MRSILVVDDDVEIRELLGKVLELEGHRVTTVPTADQALEILSREPFDLIILDLELGSASGLTILKKVREQDDKTPVVIYSGCITPAIEKEARVAGASEVLKKDIGVQILAKQIGTILRAKDRISEGSSAKKKASILFVDDEESVRSLLKGFFSGRGFKVSEAAGGAEALEVVRSNEISAVLLDIDMPEMDGLEVLSKLLEVNPRLGVVMATGNQADEKVRKAIALGAYGYVLKPFDLLYLELVVMSRLAISESEKIGS